MGVFIKIIFFVVDFMWFRRILADFLLPGPKTRTGAKLLKGPFQIFLYVQENLEYLSTVLLDF